MEDLCTKNKISQQDAVSVPISRNNSIFSFKVECPGDIEWIISLRHFMSTSLQGGSNAKYL
jgi:hypothetical protein